jgi:hypothetical protein
MRSLNTPSWCGRKLLPAVLDATALDAALDDVTSVLADKDAARPALTGGGS